MQDVVADDTVPEAPIDDAVAGSVGPLAAVVPARPDAVPHASDPLASFHEDLRRVVASLRGQLAAALDEIPRHRDLRARGPAFPERDPAGPRAVEEVARYLVAVGARDEHVFLAIPLDAVGGERDRCVLMARRESRALIAREPVVHQESVPAAQVEAVALVVGQHRVADAEAPGAGKVRAVAAEAGHLAAFDPEAVLVFRKVSPIKEDPMNVRSQVPAVERQALYRRPTGIREIEETGGIGVLQAQHAAARPAVVPRGHADQCDSRPHVELLGE